MDAGLFLLALVTTGGLISVALVQTCHRAVSVYDDLTSFKGLERGHHRARSPETIWNPF